MFRDPRREELDVETGLTGMRAVGSLLSSLSVTFASWLAGLTSPRPRLVDVVRICSLH
jgi:hypothetical protein